MRRGKILQKILTSLNVRSDATQARKTEKASDGTIFSRGADSGRKLLLSLKKFFSRTEKTPASMAVEKAVSQAGTQSIRTEKKHVRSELNQDSRKTQLLSNSTDVSKDTEKKSNQLQAPITKDTGQLNFEQSFITDFDTKIKSLLLDKIPGGETNQKVKRFCDLVISVANTALGNQINNDFNELTQENLEREIESTLNSKFTINISDKLMAEIKNAVRISFDFAGAEELRKMQTGELRR